MKVYCFTKNVLIPAKNEKEALEILQSNLDVDEYDCLESSYWDCEELDEEVAEMLGYKFDNYEEEQDD